VEICGSSGGGGGGGGQNLQSETVNENGLVKSFHFSRAFHGAYTPSLPDCDFEKKKKVIGTDIVRGHPEIGPINLKRQI
jgi:hypothetical protein